MRNMENPFKFGTIVEEEKSALAKSLFFGGKGIRNYVCVFPVKISYIVAGL